MDRKALIVYGGWDGHQPDLVAALCRELLEGHGFQVRLATSLDAFADPAGLGDLDLIVPVWTMGELSGEQCRPVLEAVAAGTGLAGCHGGMCDAFRGNVDWQFMTGGQWVAHPGNDGREYEVAVRTGSHPVVQGIGNFRVSTEHYYLHVDPAVRVLATTRFPLVDGPHAANGPVDMPVIWTKRWGQGRVFYTSLGHQAAVLQAEPVRTILERGLLWAARGSRAGDTGHGAAGDSTAVDNAAGHGTVKGGRQ